METTVIWRDYIGMVEKKMETTVVCWGYTGKWRVSDVELGVK